MYKSSSFVCVIYCARLLMKYMYVCIIKIVMCMARLLVDHPFSTINWWNLIIRMSKTLQRIPVDELTLLSDNWAVVIFWVIQVLLTPAGVERSASKQQFPSGLHYPGRSRLSRFITSGFKTLVRFGLAPGLTVNTEIVSSNLSQCPQASGCSTVYQRYVITTEVQSIQSVFHSFIPLSWTIQCEECLKYLKFSRSSSRDLWFHQNNAMQIIKWKQCSVSVFRCNALGYLWSREFTL